MPNLALPHVIDAPDVQANFDTIATKWPGRGPHCHMSRTNTAQVIVSGAAAVAVAWDTIIENSFSMFTVGAAINILKAGRYACAANCEWAANAVGSRGMYLNISTATNVFPRSPGSMIPAAPGGLVTQQSVSVPVYLPAGATVQMFVFQNSGGNLNVGGAPALFAGVSTAISVSWLGE